MVPPARARYPNGRELLWGVLRARARRPFWPARFFSRADEGTLPTSGRGSIAPHGVGSEGTSCGHAPLPPRLGEEDPREAVPLAEMWALDRARQRGQLPTE